MSNSSPLPAGEPATIFYIGQHETNRTTRTPVDLTLGAQDLGYDFLTTRITTPIFQDKVRLRALSHNESAHISPQNRNPRRLNVPPLEPEDVLITPDASNASLVAITSPWIDLGSPDATIRRLSRQVFNAELAYAAFCGINNILVYGPLPGSDVAQYARAIHEGLGLGPYINLHILLPLSGELEQDHGDGTHLAELATTKDEVELEEFDTLDTFDVWDAWNTIRTVCNYSHKLSIGKSPILDATWEIMGDR